MKTRLSEWAACFFIGLCLVTDKNAQRISMFQFNFPVSLACSFDELANDIHGIEVQ